MRLKVGKIKKEIGGRCFEEIFKAKNEAVEFFYNKVKDLGISECEAYELLLKLLEKGVRSVVEVNLSDSIITIEDWIEKWYEEEDEKFDIFICYFHEKVI